MKPISDEEIWDRYQAGASSREIAAAVGMSQSGVRYRIARAGHRLRQSTQAASRKRWNAVVWRGVRFTPDSSGYLKGHAKPYRGKALHRLIWEALNGPVPAGWFLAFKDLDRTNVRVGNLELRQGTCHRRPSAAPVLPPRSCARCGKTLERGGREKPHQFAARRFCNHACANGWKAGRGRRARLAQRLYIAAASPRESGRARAERVFGRQGTTP